MILNQLRNHKISYWSFLSFVLIFITSLIFFLVSAFSTSKEGLERKVYSNIKEEVEEINQQWLVNQEFLVGDSTTYWKDNNSITHPCAVFRNDELVYWTSNQLVSLKYLHHVVSGVYYEKLKEGDFLIVVKSEGEIITQFFIPLYFQSPFSSYYFDEGYSPEISTVDVRFYHSDIKTAVRVEDGFLGVKVTDAEGDSLYVVISFCVMVLALVFIVVFVFYSIYNSQLNVLLWGAQTFVFVVILCVFYTIVHFYLEGKFERFPVFNSSVFALGTAVSSFAELFLFMLMISVSQSVVVKFVRFLFISLKNENHRILIQWVLFYLVFYFIWDLLYHINSNSSWVYDVSESLFMSSFKLVFYLMVAFCSYWVFGALHLFNRKLKLNRSFVLIGGLLLLSIIIFYQELMLSGVLLVSYLIVLLFKSNYSKVVAPYVFSGLLSAFLVANAVVTYRTIRLTDELGRFAEEIQSFRDVETEYLLFKAGELIQSDKLISDALSRLTVKKNLIEKKILKVYLQGLSTKYKTDVLYFNRDGNRLGASSNLCFSDYEISLNLPENQTDFAHIYFREDLKTNFSVTYYSLLPIRNGDDGYILLVSKEIKQNADHVMRRLKEDKPFEGYQASAQFNYVIFENGEQIFSKGDNHLHQLKITGGWRDGTMLYFQTPAVDGVQVLVYAPYSWIRSLVINFSFYLILLFIPVFLVQLIWASFRSIFQNESAIAERIKTVVLLTLIVPMGLLSMIIYTNIDSNYQQEVREKYIEELVRLTPYVRQYAEQFEQKIISNEELEDELSLLADQSAIKFNFFDKNGFLVFTNNDELYQAGLLAKLIEPHAFRQVSTNSLVFQDIEEHIGRFKFTSIYGMIQGRSSSLGVLSIPYFNSDSVLNSKRIQVFSAFLVAFILLFLLFYVLSERLVLSVNKPLLMISQRLKALALSGNNEPLGYQGNDEIGLLVQEYNKMITKLEDSKIALAQSEKESAWREMAKQVAHEIKNPLTPMKLMLQHLQRRLAGNDEEEIQRMSDSMQSLITHVDTLSDIATSFSAFAKMPFPVNTRFLINKVVQDEVRLFQEEEGINLSWNLLKEDAFVQFDPKLLGRIITNLLLNAKQSGIDDQLVEVKIALVKRNDNIILSVEDDGCGIPEEMRQKVFLPNFTTKNTGSGIGLAVAKRGIEQGGGIVWLETEERVGTTFFIQLPLVL